MKRFAILLLISVSLSAACFGQGKQNVVQTGTVDARGANWIPPTARFATQPGSPPAGAVYLFTDASAVGSCNGGGSALATCRWSGAAWEQVGGGGGGGSAAGISGQVQVNSGGAFAAQASVLTGGTPVQRAVECASGIVDYSTLRAMPNGISSEVPIQTNLSGNVRWDQVLVSETTQFAGVNGLTVSMGRPGTSTHDEMSGAMVPLMVSSGDGNFWSTRPIPPQLTGTYSVVLNFAVPIYYSTGTVSVTNGSTAITGSGTAWTSSMTGMYISLSGVYYAFTYVSPTSGTLGTAYAGATQAGMGNAYLQNYPNQVTAGALSWEVCGYAAR